MDVEQCDFEVGNLLQVWVNTVLGEPFEPASEKLEGSGLARRGENSSSESIPDQVQLLTAGIDVEGDRLEMSIIGWGLLEESWLIDRQVLPGDPAQKAIWDDLDALLLDRYVTDAGRELRIRAACCDTGGHHAAGVLGFCRPRRRRTILPIKGIGGPRPIWPRRASRTRTNDQIFMVGVDTAKKALYGRLRITSQGPGYVHFPVGGGFDQEYFAQLTSEQLQTRHGEGRPYRVRVLQPGKRNESLDCATYALCARTALTLRLEQPAVAVPAIPSVIRSQWMSR